MSNDRNARSEYPALAADLDYPRPVRLGITRTYAIELAAGIYRLMGKRSALTGRFHSRG